MLILRPHSQVSHAHDIIGAALANTSEKALGPVARAELSGILSGLCWVLGHEEQPAKTVRDLLRDICRSMRRAGLKILDDETNEEVDLTQLWASYPLNRKEDT